MKRHFAWRRLRALLLASALVASGVAGGCDRGTERGAAEESPPVAAPVAAEGEMCAEHGVLEAVCTRCNPALIPVFKAKGDWCEEHGVPLSICPVHNPEAGGRPAAAVAADDGAPADGTKIRFKTPDTARMAGIAVAPVQRRSLLVRVVVPARVAYDATGVARLNASAAGVVRSIEADVGTRVEIGAPLAVIESAGVGADVSALGALRSRVRIAEANLERNRKLLADGLTSERNLLDAERAVADARAALASRAASVGVVGKGARASGHYTLTSPIAGVVARRNVTAGLFANTDDLLFEVVDTSRMWVILDVPEADAHRVRLGSPVTVELSAVDDLRVTGEVSYVAPEVDPRTRTVEARVPVANPDGLLRANMLGEATVAVARPHEALVVPTAALQRAGDAELVFVRLSVDLYEARRVRSGLRDGDLVEVEGRLEADEAVVTDGSFLLKTETLRGSIGAGCCEVE